MPSVTSAALGIAGASAALGPIGAALSGAGALYSALGPQGGDNSDYNKHRLVKLVRDAKDAGIHPLYAMGAAGAYSPGLGMGPDYGAAAQAMGSTLSKMDPAARAQKTVDDGGLRAAQIRALNSAAGRDDAAAEASRSQLILQLLKQNGTQSAVSGPLGNYVENPAQVTAARPSDPSYSAGPNRPGSVPVTGPFGETQRVPDQNLTDADLPGAIMYLEGLYKDFLHDPVKKWLNTPEQYKRKSGKRPFWDKNPMHLYEGEGLIQR